MKRYHTMGDIQTAVEKRDNTHIKKDTPLVAIADIERSYPDAYIVKSIFITLSLRHPTDPTII